jgi:hypothetical protein
MSGSPDHAPADPDGRTQLLTPVVARPEPATPPPETDTDADVVAVHPSRVLRLAAMTQALLEEIHRVELDEAARHRLATVFNQTVEVLRELLSEDLQGEIDRLELRLPDRPTSAELQVAQAQLVGWLEGLFHGIRTTVIASHLATQEELARAYQHGIEAARDDANRAASSTYL